MLNDIAELAYDALGGRIKKYDADANETTLYYNNYNWRVLCEYDGPGNYDYTNMFIYGNYIDEVLFTYNLGAGYYYWYAHDHLYSPACLINGNGDVVERYEYDAYGDCTILESNFAPDPDGESD